MMEAAPMVELDRFDDEELLKRGRDALKLQRYPQARELLSEYCSRQTKRDLSIPTGILASYALSLGHTHSLKEGLELCLKAVASDRRNPHIYWSLAQLYMLSGSRKKAIEALEIGLRVTPDHRGLLKLRDDMGVRKRPPIGFLSRDSVVNVKLGKALHRMKTGGRRAARS
ncbi:MAG: tetratricopeptide repeat protein [Thermoanaerobaculia bacterium]